MFRVNYQGTSATRFGFSSFVFGDFDRHPLSSNALFNPACIKVSCVAFNNKVSFLNAVYGIITLDTPLSLKKNYIFATGPTAFTHSKSVRIIFHAIHYKNTIT